MTVDRRCETVDLFAEFVQSDATTFLPGHMGRLSELDPACPGGEIPGERFVGDHVADELLPLFFERVLTLAVVEDRPNDESKVTAGHRSPRIAKVLFLRREA